MVGKCGPRFFEDYIGQDQTVQIHSIRCVVLCLPKESILCSENSFRKFDDSHYHKIHSSLAAVRFFRQWLNWKAASGFERIL